MTISTQTARAQYAGNGVTTSFAVPFEFLTATPPKVVYTDAAGLDTVWVLTTNYTLTGGGAQQPATGSITALVAPASGTKITLLRNEALTQAADYIPNDPFPAVAHEKALDRLSMQNQMINEKLGRAIGFKESSATADIKITDEPAAGKILGYNSTGTALVNKTAADFGDGFGLIGAAGLEVLGKDTRQEILDYLDAQATDIEYNGFPLNGGVVRDIHDKLKESISVTDFGVIPNSGSDQTILIQAAFDYLGSVGGGVMFYPAGTYKQVGVAVPSNVKVSLDIATVIEQATNANSVFAFEGVLGSAVLLTGTVGRGSTQIPLASTTGIVAGDWLIITDTVDYSVVSDAVGYKSGQSVQVESVAGLNVNIKSPLLGSMQVGAQYTVANGARIQKVTPLENISFEGGGRIHLLQTNNTNGIYARYVKGLTVHDLKINHFGGSGVFPRDCINVDIGDCEIWDGLDNVGAGFPGYGVCVGGACDNVNVHDNFIHEIRHGVTTIGGTTGFPINLEIYDNIVFDPSFIGIDTHAAGINVNIEDNSITGGVVFGTGTTGPGGINLRTPFTRVIGNDISNMMSTGIGFAGEDLESITISGNKIRRGSGDYAITGGVTCSQLTITDNTIEDVAGSGITIFGSDAAISPNLLIARNKINGFGLNGTPTVGIQVAGSQANIITVTDNHISENGKTAGNATSAIIISAPVSTDSIIGRNTASGTFSAAAFDFSGQVNLGNFDNILVGNPRNSQWAIADDNVRVVPCSSGVNLVVSIGSAGAGTFNPNGLFRARTNASPMCAAITTFVAGTPGPGVNFVATALTGTTGTDGSFTIGATNGNLYFENRSGGTMTIWIEIHGPVVT